MNLSVYKTMIDELGQRMRYILLANEVGGKTNKKHWQGFLYFANPRTEKSVRTMTCGAHIEPCYGDAKSNINYCRKGSQSHEEWEKKKEKGPNWGKDFSLAFEHGDEPAPGKRTDMEEMWCSIQKKQITTAAQICDANPGLYFRYAKNMEKALELTPERQIQRTWKTTVKCFWGQAGRGKSNQVTYDYAERSGDYLSGMSENDIQMKYKTKIDWISVTGDKNAPFFGGYTGSDTVCFDDFNPLKMDQAWWLTLTDRNPMVVNTKGGFVNWNPKYIYFTANADPKYWWGGISAQIERRFSVIAEIDAEELFEDIKPVRIKIVLKNPLSRKGVVTVKEEVEEKTEQKTGLFTQQEEKEEEAINIAKIILPEEVPKNFHTKEAALALIELENAEARAKIAKKKKAPIVVR
uniref:Replication-associated protein n=1 Tax=Turdus hortulorum CRESS-DNA-virus sp. TaxID=2815062 RepID=A0A8A4XCS3_9VIRU|nr:MAG: replication-associated protein [Turdus hortulorum CRESS-DNA-virus sp.]